MDSSHALYFVALNFVGLWSLGKLVNYGQKFQMPIDINKRKHIKLINELHIIDLDQYCIEEIRILVAKKDISKLAQFLAIHKPVIVEISDYTASLRQQLNRLLAKNFALASEIEKVTALNQLELTYHILRDEFSNLSEAELRAVLEIEQSHTSIINEAFISQFGGDLFMEYFIIYSHLCRENPAVFHIPPNNKLHRLFETLEDTGVAIRGDKIKLKERLTLFHLAQLNQIAANLNFKIYFSTKDEAVSTLSKTKKKNAENYFNLHYEYKDVFKLIPPSFDIKAVEQEWTMYNAYAKILCNTGVAQ